MGEGEKMKVEIEWISFNERKPEKCGFYLLETDDHGEAICGRFNGNKWFYTNSDVEIDKQLLHWAFKPELPRYLKLISGK